MTEEAWRGQLRARGQRVTPQREAILRAVQGLPHPTAESIHAHLVGDEPGLSLSTVYRTLAVLQELQILTHAHIGSGPPVYHLTDRPSHIHLSCLACGAVTSIPVELAGDFAEAVAATTGFTLDPTHAAVYGRCAACETLGP